MYFKLIKDNTIFGIITEDFFRRFQPLHHMIIYSNINKALFIEYKNEYYYDNWLKRIPLNCDEKITLIQIILILYEEYQILELTFQTLLEIIIQLVEEFVTDDLPEEKDTTTIDFVKKVKIAEIKRDNKLKLLEGLDIILDNGEIKHFSISDSGLFNLILTILNNVLGYSEETIKSIINQINQFKLECDIYCQNLILQVNNLENIININNIHYLMQGQILEN